MKKELLKKNWFILWIYIIANIGGSLGVIINATVRAKLVDNLVTTTFGTSETLLFLIQNLLLVFLITYFFPFLILFFENKLNNNFSKIVLKEINIKKSCIPYSLFEDSNTNDIIALSNEAEKQLFVFLKACVSIAVSLIQLISTFWVLKSIGIVNLIAVVLLFVPTVIVSINSASKYYDTWTKTAKLRRHCDYQRNILTAKEYSLERTLFAFSPFFQKEWQKEYNKVRSASIKEELKGSLKVQISGIVLGIYVIFLLIILFAELCANTITLGYFISIVSIIPNLLSNLVDKTAQNINIVVKSQKSVVKLKEFFNLPEERASSEVNDFRVFCKIEFKNVNFKYPNSDKFVLKNINLKIESGKKYTMVGENGAGKTTIVNLLLGLYEPTSGEILINDRNLSTYSLSDLCTIITPLFQSPQRFSLSAFENIGIGNIEMLEQSDRILKAAEKSKASSVINELKYQYDTILDSSLSNGQSLSGGEWQKIFLARIFMSDTPVCILDEPSSSVDPFYENWLSSNFNEIMREKTCLIVSHRLAFSRKSDEVIVIEKGQIVEQGNHFSLMRRKGLYYKMYTAQESMYFEEE